MKDRVTDRPLEDEFCDGVDEWEEVEFVLDGASRMAGEISGERGEA